MKRNQLQILFCGSGLLVLLVLAVLNIEGRQAPITSSQGVSVVKAVAPGFVPFVFNKTGVAEVTVEVTIDKSGSVKSAKAVDYSVFTDGSIEDTAKKWVFTPSKEDVERSARLRFVFRILPEETDESELTTVFVAPFEMEVRSKVIPSPKTTSPLPVRN